ncbi:stress response protein Nst1 [Streptococcus uberis]|uniref:stress response protein Nst1 n=1 Tax=Streptococcus uberis TaxID=1349 RepID=UPI0020BFB503|nr:stress response protein Nst1 [Streptococcus uberis]
MGNKTKDLNSWYAELSEKAEYNIAEKEAERVRLVNERAERERAKRDEQANKLQGLLAKAMQMEIDEKEKLAQAKQEEHIKELEKQWEKEGDYKTEETLKVESGIKSMLTGINSQWGK